MLTAMAASLDAGMQHHEHLLITKLTSIFSTAPLSTSFPSPSVVTSVPAPVIQLPAPPGFHTRGPWVAGALYKVVPAAALAAVAEPATEDDDPLWYCITSGSYVGVTQSHALAVAAVSGVSRSAMKSYKSQTLALAAFNDMLRLHMVVVAA
jgi:hypothetical protein